MSRPDIRIVGGRDHVGRTISRLDAYSVPIGAQAKHLRALARRLIATAELLEATIDGVEMLFNGMDNTGSPPQGGA